MTIAGFTRFRSHQWGVQTVIGTAVAATRVMPYRGAIEVNPNREIPDVDTGSIDPILSPTDAAVEWTASLEAPGATAFNDLPYVYHVGIKGGVTPSTSGTAKTYTFQAASLTADTFGYITDEWGDDTTASDGLRAYGGTADGFTLGFGDDLGVWDTSLDMIYASGAFVTAKTGALTIDTAPTWVYGADTEVYLDTTPGAIGTTKLVDAIHGAQLQVANNLDQKRFANGSNTRFVLAGFGRGPREINVTMTVAKTAATMAERATLDDSPVPNRYIELKTTSTSAASVGIPYSQSIRVPARLISVSDGELNNNSTLEFTYRGFYDPTLTYAIKAVVVCTLAAL